MGTIQEPGEPMVLAVSLRAEILRDHLTFSVHHSSPRNARSRIAKSRAFNSAAVSVNGFVTISLRHPKRRRGGQLRAVWRWSLAERPHFNSGVFGSRIGSGHPLHNQFGCPDNSAFVFASRSSCPFLHSSPRSVSDLPV